MCADICVRLMLGDYAPSLALWYALEPLLQSATLRLFGASDVGSGEHEEEQRRAILATDEVRDATAFFAWATDSLLSSPPRSPEELGRLQSRARAIAPSFDRPTRPRPGE